MRLGVALRELHEQAIQRIGLDVVSSRWSRLSSRASSVFVLEEARRRLQYCIPLSAGKVDERYDGFFRLLPLIRDRLASAIVKFEQNIHQRNNSAITLLHGRASARSSAHASSPSAT